PTAATRGPGVAGPYAIVRRTAGMMPVVFALEALLAVAVVAATVVVGARLGGALLARLGVAPSAERAVAGTAVGLGLLSHAIFALGLCGALGRWLPIGLIALALPLARPLARLRPRRWW